MWEKLYTLYLQIEQGVIYSIFQEILNYVQINKLKSVENLIMSRFADIRFLIK